MFYTSLPELKKLEHQNLAFRRKAFRTLLIWLFRKNGSDLTPNLSEGSDQNQSRVHSKLSQQNIELRP